VEASGYFDPVEGPPVAGDLLGFRLGHTLHHVAIMLRGGRMVHVMAHHGVKTAVCIPTPWAKRLEKIWRLR
jgi:cell wall-associated NlpC family hydrolase